MKLCMRFLRDDGIFRSDVVASVRKSLGQGAASRWSGPAQTNTGHDGRNAPRSSSTMSSGRLFLDRVARQQSPSPLHRQVHPKTVPGWTAMNLQRTANSVLSVCLSQGDNRSCATRNVTGWGKIQCIDALTKLVSCLVAKAANQLTKRVALDGKLEFSDLRTRLKTLMQEFDDIHERLHAHRDKHGC
jgi:hypothetical protein